ncbi:MAG: YceD family protein [Candidatus Promineifilaceae bacterium]
MGDKRAGRLRFNVGFLLEAPFGTSRTIELDYPEVHAEDVVLRPLTGAFEASRNSKGIYLKGKLHTNITAECSRCLEPIQLPITGQLDELFYYPPWDAPAGELIVGENGFIDLGPLVRQLSLLEIPMRVYCRPDCRGLCVECGRNLNDAPCEHEQKRIDPRFEVLRDLLDS